MIPSISSTPAPQQQQITGAYQGPPETPYIIFLVQYVYTLTFTANNKILAAIGWLAIYDIGKIILFNTNNNNGSIRHQMDVPSNIHALSFSGGGRFQNV